MSSSKPAFRQIGAGACGSVWAPDRPGPASAIKREDMNSDRSIRNEAVMHKRIEAAVQTLRNDPNCLELVQRINIPTHKALVQPEDEWWDGRIDRFPKEVRSRCQILVSERIQPFPQDVRERLIERYFTPETGEICRKDRANEDCMLRCYIGKRKTPVPDEERPKKFEFYSLRNKPVTVDMLEALGCDIRAYAEIMADTLAVLYWGVKVDAGDVEFVLAPPRLSQIHGVFNSDLLGPHALWMLDFDLVRDMSMDEDGVEQAVNAFWINDRYYPRPGKVDEKDQELWRMFKERLLMASEKILGIASPSERLPGMLVERLEERGRE